MDQSKQQAQPIPQPAAGAVFDMEEAQRVSYFKALGARNVEPPRVKSSHLKVIASGRVLPWEEILAEQTELVVNCDAYGNTDPAAWLPTVDTNPMSEEEKQLLIMTAQNTVLSQALQITDEFRDSSVAEPAVSLPTEYPSGIIPFDDIDKLNAMLDT